MIAYHIVLPLPHEFSIKQNWALVVKFILRELRAHGYICQVAMHRPDPESPLNWHVHLLVATREVDGGKVGNKIRGVLADFTNRPGGSGYISKDVSWPDRWLAYQQDFARRYGITIKTSPKSAVRVPHIGTAIRVSDSSDRPNPHPLAGLHRQVLGQLRRAGIDGRLGRTDVDCFEAVRRFAPNLQIFDRLRSTNPVSPGNREK